MEMTKDDSKPRAHQGLRVSALVSGDVCDKLVTPLDVKRSKAWVFRKARVRIIWGQKGHLVHFQVLCWEDFQGKKQALFERASVKIVAGHIQLPVKEDTIWYTSV